jgi:hypothetical protein
MMQLTGLHLLLTYQCNFECEHCFVWGSPWQTGTMTLKQIRHIVQQAKELGTVEWFYFEGGEPFLYYPIMLAGIREAAQAGFKTGIVTNSYWASELEDAVEWLRPFAGWIHGLSISSDLYHFSEKQSQQAKHARAAAEELGIALDVIQVAEPEATTVAAAVGQLPPGESGLMCRGRAAQKLSSEPPVNHGHSSPSAPTKTFAKQGECTLIPLATCTSVRASRWATSLSRR